MQWVFFSPLLVFPITGSPGCGVGNVGDTGGIRDKLLLQEGMDIETCT